MGLSFIHLWFLNRQERRFMENLCDFSRGDHLVHPPFLEPIHLIALAVRQDYWRPCFLEPSFFIKANIVQFWCILFSLCCKSTLILSTFVGGRLGRFRIPTTEVPQCRLPNCMSLSGAATAGKSHPFLAQSARSLLDPDFSATGPKLLPVLVNFCCS